MTEFPEPLTPLECDLRGLEYMPLLGTHLFGSEFNARANDSEWRAALTLWWAAWCQVPAASLPDDDTALCRFADLGRDVKAWRKLRERALHGWVKCNDGRLYHPTLAKQALLAWDKRKRERNERSADTERKARERADRSRMFADLAELGVTPEWNIKTRDLRELVTKYLPAKSDRNHEPVTRDIRKPVTSDVTAKTGRDGTGRDDDLISLSYESSPISPEPKSDDPPALRPEHVVEAWNEMAERRNLPRVAKLTPERKRKLQVRIREHPLDDWMAALDAIERSSFLLGDNDRGWRADFDFLLQPSSFQKLIEGRYDRPVQ